jgi:23S rRNA U2552 (ribose-2'-O)-methylase RlmE/FtsJ
MSSYTPFIYKLPNINNENDMFKNNNISASSNISQPLFSLGFHSFIQRTKSGMEITKQWENTNKLYYVVNPFEHTINDYDKDIMHISENFLNKPSILSRAFYKLWEILYLFDIAGKDKLSALCIAEGPGSFIQAIVEFRKQYFDPSNDSIHGLTIAGDDKVNINTNMVNNINKKYENMINVIKTAKTKTSANGDITKIQTHQLLKDTIKTKVDLITADGGFEWKNESYQEQEAYVLILGEIYAALSNQAKGGSFVLKIFETFTHLTIKLIYLLTQFYEDVYIYKPFLSRSTNSEKYIVCKGFKSITQKQLDLIDDILRKAGTEKMFINDIFIDFNLTEEHLNILKYININIANVQQIIINKLIVYIKSNNYFGDSYHGYREEQIKANKWWIDTFFSEKLTEKTTYVNQITTYNNSELKLFIKNLI